MKRFLKIKIPNNYSSGIKTGNLPVIDMKDIIRLAAVWKILYFGSISEWILKPVAIHIKFKGGRDKALIFSVTTSSI